MKNNKHILITGGSGFLGINLIRHLIAKGMSDITVLDIAEFDYLDMKGHVHFIKGDIRNKDIVKKAMQGIDFVIHTAAALPLSCWILRPQNGEICDEICNLPLK